MVIAANEETMETDETSARRLKTSVLDQITLLRDAGNSSKLPDGGAKILNFLSRSEDANIFQYTLKRIVRSLGGNQQETRSGFFSALTVLLRRRPDITVSHLLELVKQELRATASKSEAGDVAVGQLLVCGAVFRSGLALRATEEERRELLALLFSASRTKSYLKSAAYLLLVDFVETLDEEQFRLMVWCNVAAEVTKPVAEQSLDSLYFLLKVADRFPKVVKLRKFLGVDEIIGEDTVHAICEKLMNIIDFNQTNHPIYQHIGVAIANSQHLKLFWTSGIDSQLTKHNRNRELVAINLLTAILNHINTNFEVIPELLTKNFFKLFLDWFRGLQTASKCRNRRDDEEDNKIMIKKEKEVLNALAKALKSEEVANSVKINVLKKLLFYPGDMNLTEITSTTVVKSIIMSLNKEGVKKMAKLFKGVLLNESKKFVKEGTERPWFNYERLKASEYLSHLVLHPAVAEETTLRLNYMKLLMCFGFFKIGGNENVGVSSDLSGGIKTSFYRCLNSHLSTVDSLVDILRSLCSNISEYTSDERIQDKLLKQFPQQNMDCWATLKRITDSIENNTDKKKVDNVFLILLYQLGLFLFSEPKHVEIAKESIKELASCYDHYKKDAKKKKEKLKEGDLALEEPEWIEVLVEVLLSILSSESSVLRSVVQCVFRLLWEYLTPSSIGQIVSVLDPDSDNNPLMQEDEDSDSDSDSDTEKVKENGHDENNESNDESEGNSDASDTDIEDDEDDEEMKIPDQLRLAVQKALGNAAPDTDTESVDADMIDEEEGKKLDKALSDAFKLLRQGKNKKSKKDRKDKKTLTDFRSRVLDLIDIYLDKEPAMDICLGMLAPLMRCLEFCIQDCEQRELEHRVRKTLKILTNLKKFSSTEGVTVELLCDYLKASIEKGSRTQFIFQALGNMVTECGAFVVQCSQKLDAQRTPSKKKIKSPLVTIYKDSLVSFFQNRNCLLPIIFFHKILQIDWEGNLALVPIIIENSFSCTVRQFRKHEGLELLAGFYVGLKRLKLEDIVAKLEPIELALEDAVKRVFDESNEDFIVKDQFFKLLRKIFLNIEKFHASVNGKCPIDIKLLNDLLVSSKKGMKLKREKYESTKKNTQAASPNQPETNGQKKKRKKHKRPNPGGASKEPEQKKIKS